MNVREKLFNALLAFDGFLDRLIKCRWIQWRTLIAFGFGGGAGAAYCRGRHLLAYWLLAAGLMVGLGAFQMRIKGK